jgi:hypothetical protein
MRAKITPRKPLIYGLAEGTIQLDDFTDDSEDGIGA